MSELRCSACGAFLQERESVLGIAAGTDDASGMTCPSCGHVGAPREAPRGPFGAIRAIAGGLDTLIGLMLLVILCGFVVTFVVAPLLLAFEYYREGDLVRGTLLTVLVLSYTVIGARAAVRRELSPGIVLAALPILVVIGWLATRLPH